MENFQKIKTLKKSGFRNTYLYVFHNTISRKTQIKSFIPLLFVKLIKKSAN